MESLQLPISDLPGSTSPNASYNVHRQRSLPMATLVVQLTDFAMLLLPLLAVCGFHSFAKRFSTGELVVAGGCGAAASYVWLYHAGTYQISCLSRMPPRLWIKLISASLLGALLFGISLHMLPSQSSGLSNLFSDVAYWTMSTLGSLSVSRLLWRRTFAGWIAAGILQRRAVVVGDDEGAGASVQSIATDPDSNLKIVGFHSDGYTDLPPDNSSADPARLELLARRCCHDNIDAVILAVPLSQGSRIESIRGALRSVAVDVYIIPSLSTSQNFRCGLQVFGQTPVVKIGRRPLDDWQHMRKTLFDYSVAGLSLAAMSPVLLLIGIVVKFDSSGPALFRQRRLGFNGKPFLVHKFRTMYDHRDFASLSGSRQAQRDDPRITRVGKWLRRLSLDELPQLLNVVRGEMSLVGPRPHPLNTGVEGRLFQDLVKDYAVRHRVLPGITGWAQVNGCRGETVKLEQIEQRVAFDLFYIDNWSLAFDIKIIIRTLAREILSSHAF